MPDPASASAASATRSGSADEGLVRAMGVRELAATIFNIMVGGGIFVLPAVAAAHMGARAPVAYVVCALAAGLVVLCFAEAGSRVSLTGGPYAYVGVAFGPFAGFLAGVLLWTLLVFASAAVASALVASAAVFWPALAQPALRALLLVLVLAAVAAVNVRGVRSGARLVELVTVAKLLPLLLLVAAGFFVTPAPAAPGAAPAGDLGRTVVILFFAFAGVEGALTPSGEVRHPERTVPRALGMAMLLVTALYIAIQLVSQRALGVAALAAAGEAPLAAVAARIAGRPGAVLLAAGAVISMFGGVSGIGLAAPRALYAMGRDGFIPLVSRPLGSIHPQYRTPHVAIVTQAAIVAALAVTSGFARLAVLANVAVLTLYLVCALAVLELRRRDVRTGGGVPFRVPGGPLIPVAAAAVIVWILLHATVRELTVVAGVLAGAALFFVLSAPSRRAAASPDDP